MVCTQTPGDAEIEVANGSAYPSIAMTASYMAAMTKGCVSSGRPDGVKTFSAVSFHSQISDASPLVGAGVLVSADAVADSRA